MKQLEEQISEVTPKSASFLLSTLNMRIALMTRSKKITRERAIALSRILIRNYYGADSTDDN
ncbi:MAG: hypothetical protein QM689_04725 [Oscillospiraceae bacterium]